MLRFALTAAAAVLLVATPAAADTFQSFTKTCLTSDGNAAAALTAAGDLGWKPIPSEVFEDGAPEGLQDLTVLTNFDPNSSALPEQLEMLMIGAADGGVIMDAPGVMMGICGVMASDVDIATLTQQASSYLGGQPQLTGEYTVWIYSRQNGRITLEPGLMEADDAVIEALVRERSLFAVYVIEEDSLSGLMLGAFRSTKGAAR